jgi:hypothetical protein
VSEQGLHGQEHEVLRAVEFMSGTFEICRCGMTRRGDDEWRFRACTRPAERADLTAPDATSSSRA